MASEEQPPTVAAAIALLGRRAIRTRLRELDTGLDVETARSLEAAITRMGELWKHKSLVVPAVNACIVAEQLAPNALAPHMRALDQSTPPGPAHRVATLAMLILAEPIDLDDGVVLPGLSKDTVTQALVAWIVRRFGVTVADFNPETAELIWLDAELDPTCWPVRVERLTTAYEKEKYGV